MLAIVVAVTSTFQVVALAWIAAWQQRAAAEVRKLNGAVVKSVHQAVAESLVRNSGPQP